jgi:hypothetical protein
MFAGPDRGRKEPWDWTDEERVAARFDPASIAERNAAYEASDPRVGRVASDKAGVTTYVIEGKRNPELLFPHELFDMLLAGIDPRESNRLKARARFDPGIRALGVDEAVFWERIDDAAHDYFAAVIAGHGGAHEAGSRCELRKALETSAMMIGRETLYRVLYTVVAPGMWSSGSTNSPHPAKDLLNEAKGCAE